MAITRGELARQSGCNAETIRYYEKIGLLPEPARTAGGRRSYGAADVNRLRLVRRCRELGFPLQAIPDLLSLAEADGKPICADMQGRLKAQAAELRRRIADLKRIERWVDALAEDCHPEEAACRALERLTRAEDGALDAIAERR